MSGVTFTSILVSIAISAALTGAKMLIGALFSQQQSSGGRLAPAAQRDPGTEITVPRSASDKNIIFGTARASGNIVYMGMNGNNQNLDLIVEWAGHQVSSYGALYFDDEIIPLSGAAATGKYAGKAFCTDYFGGDDQIADENLISLSGGAWTTAHRGRGVAYSYIQLAYDRTLFPQGLPNIWRVVNGMLLYDPRTGTTTFSYNAALAAAAFLNSSRFGRGVSYADMEGVSEAADICDEAIALAAGGTEPRYTANGILSSGTTFVDNFEDVLSASMCKVTFAGGVWVFKVGAWPTPETEGITLDMFRDGFTLQTMLPKTDAFNAVKGTFNDPARLYQKNDFPAVISSAYELEDGGDGDGSARLFKDVDLKLTNSASMAQRIARVDLRKARQPMTFTAPLKIKGLRYQVGDVVPVTISDFLGWTNKYFEVTTVEMVTGSAGDGQIGIIGVDLGLRETAEFIFDWTAEDDEITYDPAPNTTLPNPFSVGLPSNLQAVESLYATRNGGGVKARVTLTWDASTDGFVLSGGWYVPEYKLSADTQWTQGASVRNGKVSTIFQDMDPGTYDYRVWAYNFHGSRSATALTIVSQPLTGLSGVPVAPQNLTMVPNGNYGTFRWDAPADLDVEVGGHIVFKHANTLAGATWPEGVTISRPLAANTTYAVLPLVAGAYMAKFKDTSGIWSDDFAVVYTGQSGALTFDAIVGGSLVEDPAFTGVKTDCVVSASELKLGGVALFSAIPVLSAIPSVGYYGGVVATGTYAWSAPIDLGSVTRGRLTITKTTMVLDVFELITERTGDVSTWPMFGGDISGNEADARTEVRFTDDDPNGSPTWSAWSRVEVCEFNCRGIGLRTILESFDPSFDIEISALSAIAEEVI